MTHGKTYEEAVKQGIDAIESRSVSWDDLFLNRRLLSDAIKEQNERRASFYSFIAKQTLC